MSRFPEDYYHLVIEDIKKYEGIRVPLKANFMERHFTKKIAPEKLHPNPSDEFSWESIGPNLSIVNNYVSQIRNNMGLGLQIFDEPLIVEKMGPDGYMLINGHHRWYASIRAGAKTVPIDIVNLTHEEDLKQMLANASSTMRVAFDLDEVLLTMVHGFDEEPITNSENCELIQGRLRVGAVKLLKALKEKHYDIWVYTNGYNSIDNIEGIFGLYDLKIDGIINGMQRKGQQAEETKKALKEMLQKTYEKQLHIDNESVLLTHSKSKEFEQFDIVGEQWAEGVIQILNKLS